MAITWLRSAFKHHTASPYSIINLVKRVMASHITGEVYAPSLEVAKESHVRSMEEYREMYKRSVEDPVQFWSEIAEQFYWKQKWETDSVLKYNFDVRKGDVSVEWFRGAVTNICYNCLDRHVRDGRGEAIAFYW